MENNQPNQLYTLFSYKDGESKFDYDRYKRVQQAGNLRKIQNIWVQRETLEVIAEYLKARQKTTTEGICHGTRRGLEQKWFTELTGANVIGTEISDSATQFSATIQHDFHEIKAEWQNKFDFIYSNSFDHSYDPKLAINAWMRSLKDTGFCFIEHTHLHGSAGVNETDPFGAQLEIMPYLILL